MVELVYMYPIGLRVWFHLDLDPLVLLLSDATVVAVHGRLQWKYFFMICKTCKLCISIIKCNAQQFFCSESFSIVFNLLTHSIAYIVINGDESSALIIDLLSLVWNSSLSVFLFTKVVVHSYWKCLWVKGSELFVHGRRFFYLYLSWINLGHN